MSDKKSLTIKTELSGANLQMFEELKALYKIKPDVELVKLLINLEYWSIRKKLGRIPI